MIDTYFHEPATIRIDNCQSLDTRYPVNLILFHPKAPSLSRRFIDAAS